MICKAAGKLFRLAATVSSPYVKNTKWGEQRGRKKNAVNRIQFLIYNRSYKIWGWVF